MNQLKKDLGFTIKIISPKININRFFQNENPRDFILELINISQPVSTSETLFVFPEGILSNIYFQDLKKFKSIFQIIFQKNIRLF